MNGFYKTQACVFHQKSYRRAVCTAAKTMVELFGWADGKTRGFFIVKRATGRVVCTGLFKRDRFINHVHDIDAIE